MADRVAFINRDIWDEEEKKTRKKRAKCRALAVQVLTVAVTIVAIWFDMKDRVDLSRLELEKQIVSIQEKVVTVGFGDR